MDGGSTPPVLAAEKKFLRYSLVAKMICIMPAVPGGVDSRSSYPLHVA
jgi:hypothetical protein